MQLLIGGLTGSGGWQIPGLILASCAAVGIGLAISAAARSVLQAVMIVPLVLIPQILFSGFIPPAGDRPIFCFQDHAQRSSARRDGYKPVLAEENWWGDAGRLSISVLESESGQVFKERTDLHERKSRSLKIGDPCSLERLRLLGSVVRPSRKRKGIKMPDRRGCLRLKPCQISERSEIFL